VTVVVTAISAAMSNTRVRIPRNDGMRSLALQGVNL